MRILFIGIIILVVVLLLGGVIHSLVSRVPLVTAFQDVIGGIVGIVSDLGNAIARVLTNILPHPGRN
jgi:Na+/H+ antiporter NhaD/arsenite permease-like protein